MAENQDRTEFVTAGDGEPAGELAPGVLVRVLANGDKGACGLTTGTATLAPGAMIPYHTHPTGEAITVVRGAAVVLVEGRCYQLRPFDSIHVPDGVAHAVRNAEDAQALLHTTFPTALPERDFVDRSFAEVECARTADDVPEQLRRFETVERYAAGEGIEAVDLFAGRFGAEGMCGGYARFLPGTAIPCHLHDYDESISIVGGRAVCRVAGRQYELSDLDTACVPAGRPHRFLNLGEAAMEMIWVYAGNEPARRLVEPMDCE